MSFCSSLLIIADFKASDFLKTFLTRLSAATRSLLSLVTTIEWSVFRSLLSLVMASAEDRGLCNLNLDFLNTSSVLSAFPEFCKKRNRQILLGIKKNRYLFFLLGIKQRNSIFRILRRKQFYQQVTLNLNKWIVNEWILNRTYKDFYKKYL